MFQDELGLSRELMFKLPPEKRWELYLSKQKVPTHCIAPYLSDPCTVHNVATQTVS